MTITAYPRNADGIPVGRVGTPKVDKQRVNNSDLDRGDYYRFTEMVPSEGQSRVACIRVGQLLDKRPSTLVFAVATCRRPTGTGMRLVIENRPVEVPRSAVLSLSTKEEFDANTRMRFPLFYGSRS